MYQDSFQGVSCALLKSTSCSQVPHVTDVLLLSQDPELLRNRTGTQQHSQESLIFPRSPGSHLDIGLKLDEKAELFYATYLY